MAELQCKDERPQLNRVTGCGPCWLLQYFAAMVGHIWRTLSWRQSTRGFKSHIENWNKWRTVSRTQRRHASWTWPMLRKKLRRQELRFPALSCCCLLSVFFCNHHHIECRFLCSTIIRMVLEAFLFLGCQCIYVSICACILKFVTGDDQTKYGQKGPCLNSSPSSSV